MDDMKQYAVSAAALADAPVPRKRRYMGRPLGVWLVLFYAIMWMGGIAATMVQIHYLTILESGQRSLLTELIGWAFPLATFIGALYLFAMRKAAIWIFALHALWAVIRIITHHGVDLSGIVIDVVIAIYAWRLAQRGELR